MYVLRVIPLLVALVSPPPPSFPLTVESIMRGYALVGHAPRSLKWSSDSSRLWFSWAKADGSADPNFRDYVVQADGTGLKPSEDRESGLPGGADVRDGKAVYSGGGDLLIMDVATRKVRRLTTTAETEEDPSWTIDGRILFKKGGNLFRLDPTDGSVAQLTDIRPFTPAEVTATVTPNPSQTALAAEQAKLFKNFSPSGFRGGFGRGGADRTAGVQLTLPQGYSVGRLEASDSGNFAVLELNQSSAGVRIANVPSFVTRSGYTEELPTYEKVGDAQGRSIAWIVDLKSGAKTEVTAPRPGRISDIQWAPNGETVVVRADAEDNKDSWLYTFSQSDPKLSLRWTEHDDAWVGGAAGSLGWYPDSSRIFFTSEKSGYAHLWAMPAASGDAKPLTSGNFEVTRLDLENDHFLFVSSEGSPFRRHVDRMGLDGGARTKVADLSADDDSTYAISPDGKHLATVVSTANHPAELYIDGKKVTETPTDEWNKGTWIAPPIVQIPARDGAMVPGHLYKPTNWKKGGPAVIFVHGAGYLQNVYDGWSYYYREYMFHHLLMSRGYAVLDLDYRASAGYGRDWRTAIYRHMGGKDLDDQVDGAKWLVKTLGVSPKRIGIYGGSYGGFITLMAMFTTPDVFAAGAALRPVTDWAHYNHGYTSNILNFPQLDPEAYRVSSPIYHAEGLKGALLICHGMVDTNVHFQDSVRLAERLIELGKTNWTLAPYPVENHSFRYAASWTDEYRRILDLFERNIGSGYGKK